MTQAIPAAPKKILTPSNIIGLFIFFILFLGCAFLFVSSVFTVGRSAYINIVGLKTTASTTLYASSQSYLTNSGGGYIGGLSDNKSYYIAYRVAGKSYGNELKVGSFFRYDNGSSITIKYLKNDPTTISSIRVLLSAIQDVLITAALTGVVGFVIYLFLSANIPKHKKGKRSKKTL